MKYLPLILMLSACQSAPAISCQNAAAVRAAAQLTIHTIDRVCRRAGLGAIPSFDEGTNS